MTRKAARWGDFARPWAALSVSLMATEITALALARSRSWPRSPLVLRPWRWGILAAAGPGLAGALVQLLSDRLTF